MNDRTFAGKNPFSPSSSPPFGHQDFGRESLGIVDFGRESIGFFHDDFGRESLGLLNLDNINTGRESLSFFCDDFGRESLEVLNLDNLQIGRESLLVPKLSITDCTSLKHNCEERHNSNDLFLKEPSFSTFTTFNSSSLSSFPSRVSSQSSAKTDVMNDAFLDSTDFIKRMQLYVRSAKSVSTRVEVLKKSCRLYSLPSKLETRSPLSCFNERFETNICDEAFLNSPEDDVFKDSVFIEGKHLAEKIADGSFLQQDYMLDTTNEPPDFAEVLDDDEPVRCDTETVFKTIDNLFVSTTSTNENASKNLSVTPNRENITNTPRRSRNDSSNSKDPIEMVRVLSGILSDENLDRHKINEGQNILANLAEFLNSGGSTASRSHLQDDSGHSSIDSVAMVAETFDSCGALDLSKKCPSESNISQIREICAPLDLSKKIVSREFSTNKQKSLSNIQVNRGNFSASCMESRSMFRPKKCDEKVATSKRGPMKAVLPVHTMAKTKGEKLKTTPKHAEPSSKLKKTSTPVNGTHFRPIGQSTPEDTKKELRTPVTKLFSGSRLSKPGTRTSIGTCNSSQKILKKRSFSLDASDPSVLRENSGRGNQRLSITKKVGKENKLKK